MSFFRQHQGNADRYTLYEKAEITLAVGDTIRMTKGGRTQEEVSFNNGDSFKIAGFTKEGDIRLHTGNTLSKDYGHWDYGICTTSHSSQGSTKDVVFIAQSSLSAPASSREQFYVSISRARQMAKIYTDDKRELEKSVMQSSQRMTAREIAGKQRLQHMRNTIEQEIEQQHKGLQKKHERNYERG